MKKLCLFSSFLIIVFLLFSSTLIFAQHAPCGPGTWEYCGWHVCPDLVHEVEYKCCPSCATADKCVDIGTCPGGNRTCEYASDCKDNPYCPGANSCPFIDCIDGKCVSDCVPCEPEGPTPTPTPTPTNPGTIKGNIWVDTNGNGWQTGEDLYTCSGTQTKTKLELYKAWDSTTPVATKWPANGTYEFPNLEPGRYRVKIVRTPTCDGVKYEITKWRAVTAPCDGGVRDVSDYCDTWYTCADAGETWTLRRNWPLRVCAGETTRAHLGIRQPILSCTVTLSPASLPLTVGEVENLPVASVTVQNGDASDITNINFSSSDPGVASVESPVIPPDYSTTTTAEGEGTANITAVVNLVNGGSCDCTGCTSVTVTITAADAWFQTQEGDVHAQASISDPIPATAPEPYCSLLGDGGYPGVVSYGSGTPNFGDGSASVNGWLANSSYGGITYGFAYFKSLLGLTDADFTPAPSGGISELTQDVTAYQGDLKTSNNWSIGSNKRVLIIDGKFLIKHNIRVDSNGSLVVIAKDGIGTWQNLVTVGFPSQNRLQGIFVTDGKFYTSVEDGFNFEAIAESNKKLVINGAVIAWGGTDLSRRDFNLLGGGDYSNSDTPAESYFYDPALIINSLPSLWKSTFTWQELAP